MAVMEGESAVQAVHGPALDAAKKAGIAPSDAVLEAVDAMRRDYEHQLDATFAGARGFIDAVVYPEDTRALLALAFRTALNNPGPHLGPYVLPARLGAGA
jgi:acetyl-CoA carboxylase carboxyltransferase component